MKKVIILFAAILGLNTSLLAEDGGGKMPINTSSSTFHWVGEKVTGSHNGTVNFKSGSLEMEGDKLTGGEFVIDMTTIACLDLEDAEWNQKLVGHLKSDDFFSVAKHNTAKFAITKVESKGGDKYHITGNLTIKGITHEIQFPATVSHKNGEVKAMADFKIDRTKWNVKYGSGSFFDNLGDKTISDDFEVKINLVAKH